MFSKKIENYTDSIIQNSFYKYQRQQGDKFADKKIQLKTGANEKQKKQLNQLDIRKLQIMPSSATSQFYIEKLLGLGNTAEDKQIEHLCYVQLGRKMVQINQKQIRRQFQKTNIYIRAYMLRSIYQYVQNLAQSSQNTIYILPNIKGLHFSTQKKPQQLSKYLQHCQYVDIIRNINYIIQNELYQNKKMSKLFNMTKYTIFFIVLFFVLMGAFVTYVMTSSLWSIQANEALMIFYGILLGIVMIGVLGFSMHSYHSTVEFKPLCVSIMQLIQEYLIYVNSKFHNKLQWKIGQSFFWIEVKIKENDEQYLGVIQKAPSQSS